MARYRKGTEGTEVPSVLESNHAEGDDYKENCLFVDMPPKEERSIPAQGQRSYKGVPVRTEPELDQGELRTSQLCAFRTENRAYQLEQESQDKGLLLRHFWKHGKGSIPNEPSCYAVYRVRLDLEPQTGSDCTKAGC